MYGLNTLRQLFSFKYVATYLLTKCNGKFDFRKSNVQMVKVIWHLQFSQCVCWSQNVMESLNVYICVFMFSDFSDEYIVLEFHMGSVRI